MTLEALAIAIQGVKEAKPATDHLQRNADERNAKALEISSELAGKIAGVIKGAHPDFTPDEIRATVEQCVVGNREEDVKKLINVRIFYEASSIYRNFKIPGRTDDLIERLLESNRHIGKVIEHADDSFDGGAANLIWEQDSRFHLDLCCFGRPNSSFASLVIDTIRDVCQQVGRCGSYDEARATFNEHNEIIEAIRFRHYERIFDSIRSHVNHAWARWRCRLLKDQWLANYLTPSPQFQKTEEAFFEWLDEAKVKAYAGKWVTFFDSKFVDAYKTKAAAIDDLTKRGYTLATSYTRLVTRELLGHEVLHGDE